MCERENLVFSILLQKLWREGFGNDPFEAFGSFFLFLVFFSPVVVGLDCWLVL